jgi:hypothetical protein
MATPIIAPAIQNIKSHLWQVMRGDWKFWTCVLFALAVLLFSFPIALLPIIIYYTWVRHKVETHFWEEAAQVNGWRFAGDIYSKKVPALTLQAGSRRQIRYVIEGTLGNRTFSTFSYTYYVKVDKNREIAYPFQVFSFDFKGSFPQLYLNNRHNQTSISAGEHISLPPEFEKEFSLSAPKQYEIEALEIFTPDVLSSILDEAFKEDMELVEGTMLVFTDSNISNFEDFRVRLEKAEALKDILSAKLDTAKFEKVGTADPTLSPGLFQMI